MPEKCQTLFDPPIAHTGDPQTSYDAGQKMIDSGALSFQENNVYEAICHFVKYFQDDFTPKDIACRTNIKYYTAQRRFSGLLNKGKIEKTGDKRDGCCVWEIKK